MIIREKMCPLNFWAKKRAERRSIWHKEKPKDMSTDEDMYWHYIEKEIGYAWARTRMARR